MSKGLFDRANKVRARVEQSIETMPIHVKAMGGGEFAEVMWEVADLLSAVTYELEQEDKENGK